MSYMAVLCFRKILQSYALVMLNKFPLISIILLSFISIFMIIVTLFKGIFKQKIKTFGYIVTEIGLLGLYVCCFFLHIGDNSEKEQRLLIARLMCIFMALVFSIEIFMIVLESLSLFL